MQARRGGKRRLGELLWEFEMGKGVVVAVAVDYKVEHSPHHKCYFIFHSQFREAKNLLRNCDVRTQNFAIPEFL